MVTVEAENRKYQKLPNTNDWDSIKIRITVRSRNGYEKIGYKRTLNRSYMEIFFELQKSKIYNSIYRASQAL